MTDTNGLRAAAERLSIEAYNGVDHAEMYEQPLQRARDAMLLARAYLAEHPVDKNEWSAEDCMPKVAGVTFRCDCGCNVFRKHLKKSSFKCNSCEAVYFGE